MLPKGSESSFSLSKVMVVFMYEPPGGNNKEEESRQSRDSSHEPSKEKESETSAEGSEERRIQESLQRIFDLQARLDANPPHGPWDEKPVQSPSGGVDTGGNFVAGLKFIR